MKRSDLKPGLDVAININRWSGRKYLGMGAARRATVLDGPYDTAYSRETRGTVYVHGKGELWKVLATKRTPEGEQQEEIYARSRDILGPWADHEAERERLSTEAREQAEAREARRLEAEQWEDMTTKAVTALGLDWAAHRRPGAAQVAVPVHVLDRLIELASRELAAP